MWFAVPPQVSFGIGVGPRHRECGAPQWISFGCHFATRRGALCDQLSRVPQGICVRCVSCLSNRHMVWAWTSLPASVFPDLYVVVLDGRVVGLRIF
jgi:hypothetical protein